MSFWFEFFKLAFILTYLVVGFIVAFEAILCMHGSKFAISWVRRLYSLKGFMLSTYIFYPMVLVVYLLLELIPYWTGMSKDLTKFDVAIMLYRIFPEECDECDLEK